MTKYTKKSLFSYTVLLLLTFVSVVLNHVVSHRSIFVILVLFIVFLKGQQITDIFMELKHAKRMWRIILLSYVLLLPAIIAGIYLV